MNMLRRKNFGFLFAFLLCVGQFGSTSVGQAPKPDDKKPAEKKADDKKPDDKKPADKKPADKPKTDDTKPKTAPPVKVEAKSAVVLKVMVPQENAELKIEKTLLKTTGKVREFDLPELEAGKLYEYDLEVKFEPNNYTTITRKKTVKFAGGAAVEVDLTKEDPTDKAVIRFVPTPEDIVTAMLKLGKVEKTDVVYDLGCGDGRIVIAAVKEGGAKKGVGIDLDPERVKESTDAVKAAKLEDKVEIRKGDVLDIKDLSDATVVMIYMGDELGALLEPILRKTLKPGTRVVSHRFTLGNWKPDETKTITGEDGEEYTLHLWTVKK